MTRNSASQPNRTSDALLDMLLEALQERQQQRSVPQMSAEPRVAPPVPRTSVAADQLTVPDAALPTPSAGHGTVETVPDDTIEPPPDLPTQPFSSIRLGRTLGRLALLVVALVIAINIPFNSYGTTLATALPDTASLVIRDGLVLKGSGADIYLLEDNKLRWISSLEAFDYFGFRWDQVRVVDDAFLDNFELGKPLHVLLKCDGSPHIFALEAGHRRWIKDIVTFEDEDYQWEDIKTISCTALRELPDGHPIPPDAGPSPQP